MTLLPEESILKEATGDTATATLTNKRLHYESKMFGQATSTAFFLENLDSVEMDYRSHPWLAILGAASFLLGLAVNGDTAKTVLILIGIGLLIAYYLLRQWGVKFHSARSTIFFSASQNLEDEMKEFAHTVQQAQANRLRTYEGGHSTSKSLAE